MSEEKYVFCEQGSLRDIIVNMRKNSKTYFKVKISLLKMMTKLYLFQKVVHMDF